MHEAMPKPWVPVGKHAKADERGDGSQVLVWECARASLCFASPHLQCTC